MSSGKDAFGRSPSHLETELRKDDELHSIRCAGRYILLWVFFYSSTTLKQSTNLQ